MLTRGKASLLGGILCGLLGVGGAVIFIRFMTHSDKLDQKTAQGTALIIMSIVSLFGFCIYFILKPFPLESMGLFIIGGLGGAWLGSLLVSRLSSQSLKKMFALYIGLAGLWMLFN